MKIVKALLIISTLTFFSCDNQAQTEDLNYTFLEKREAKNLNEQDGSFIICDTTSFKSILKINLSDSIRRTLVENDIVVVINHPIKKMSINTEETKTDLCRDENKKEPVEIIIDKSITHKDYVFLYKLAIKNKYRTICP